jgi:hypothetical protein
MFLRTRLRLGVIKNGKDWFSELKPFLVLKKISYEILKISLRRLKHRKEKDMKKMFVLGIVVMAISLGFNACDSGEKGGTVKIYNDLDYRVYFEIRFDGEAIRVNNGINYIDPSQRIQAVSDEDTTYAVYLGNSSYWGAAATHGELVGGDTIEIRVSDYY